MKTKIIKRVTLLLIVIFIAISWCLIRFSHLYKIPDNISNFITEIESGNLESLDSIWYHSFNMDDYSYMHIHCLNNNIECTREVMFWIESDRTTSRAQQIFRNEDVSFECHKMQIGIDSVVGISDSVLMVTEERFYELMVELFMRYSLYESSTSCIGKEVYYFEDVDLYFNYPIEEIPSDSDLNVHRIVIDSNWILLNSI